MLYYARKKGLITYLSTDHFQFLKKAEKLIILLQYSNTLIR